MSARPRLRLVDSEPAPHVVIVGAGFGGLAAARALGQRGIRVTVIDKRNHHLFQPLLYQVATAALSPADIAAPIRTILKDLSSVSVLMDEVIGIDTAGRRVLTANGAAIDYTALILATGARHSYFGREDWAEHAPGIKTLDDAVRVRRNILLAMERAETLRQEEAARRSIPITFAVVGGGPTGVEIAGAVAELTRHAAAMDFRYVSPACVRIVLIESGHRLLSALPAQLAAAAKASLEQLGVEVQLGVRVTAIDADGVSIGGERRDTAAVIWAAGVQASPAAQWLGINPTDRSGRVPADAHLQVADMDAVYAIGDTAQVIDGAGVAVPGIAAAAKQQGLYLADAIVTRLNGGEPKPFRYRNHGNLATIGRSHAVADLGWLQLKGLSAWLLWSTAHLYFLVGFRNRFVVGANWMWNYITFERGVRLITGYDGPGPTPAAAVSAPSESSAAVLA